MPDGAEEPLRWEPSQAFLKASVAFIVLGGIPVVAILRIFSPEQHMRVGMVLTFMTVGAVAGVLLRLGRPRASFFVQAFGVWTYITVAAYLFGGVGAVSVYIYPLLILMLGWLLTPGAAMALAVVTSVITLAYALAEMAGLLPPPPATSPLMRWVVEACIWFLAAVLVSKVRTSYAGRLREVQQLSDHLAERTTAVLAREAQLEGILASTSEGILAVDHEGRVIRTNRRFAELWRIPAAVVESLDDRLLLEYVTGQLADPNAFMALVQALYRSDASSTDFVTFKDGRVFERYTAPLTLEGTHTGRIWCFRDITDRRKAEERLAMAMEVTKVVPFEVDLLHDSIIFDASGLTTLGLVDSDELRTFSGWIDAVHPDDRRRFLDSIQSGFLPGSPATDCEYRMPSPDGGWEWVHTRARIIQHAANGQPSRAVGSSMNVQMRKRLEQAHLQAQKLASLGTLAGGIAHDFNNILAAIRGNVDEAALGVSADGPAADNLRGIRLSTERAAELVRRIMTFARPKEARPEPVDLRLVTLEVLKLLRSTPPAGIELRTRFAGDALDVLADSTQVHEVLVNLTTNAAHAIGRRPGAITYVLESTAVDEVQAQAIPGLAPGDYTRLSVIDDGCGMDATTVERVFDAFYTTRPVGEGTGLGLSMVHGIMRSHGGAVTVDSTPAVGSTFALYFPVSAVPARVAAPAAPAAAGPRRGLRVLYVDDEAILVSLAERMLKRLGHRVSGFQDPVAAQEAFVQAAEPFDVLITDFAMPRMSGVELARALRRADPGLPVVLVTGRIAEDERPLVDEAGIRELLLKPFSVEQLSAAVERALHASASPGAHG